MTNAFLKNSTSSPHQIGYRPDIDGLRAIAVLSVVIYHAFPKKLPGGFTGVDIFFVISGYLISTIILTNLENQNFSFIDFYKRRIRRIFPTLLIVFLFCYITGWFNFFASDYKELGKHIAAGSGFISNLVLWNEAGYFDSASESKPLLHLWSLGIEEQFYLVWPLLLWLSWKSKFNYAFIIIGIILISFCTNLALTQNNMATAAFYLPLSRFWELCAGSLLSWIHRHPIPSHFFKNKTLPKPAIFFPRNLLLGATSWLGAILIIVSIFLVNKNRHFPGAWALIPTIGAWLVIAAGYQASFNRIILSNKIMVWLGLISYPLYLWHWPLLVLPNIFNLESASSIRNTMLPISLLMAWLSYRFIEQPIRYGSKGNLQTSVLFALMACSGLIGFDLYLRDGLPNRYPHEIGEIAKIQPEKSFPFNPEKVNRTCKTIGFETLCTEKNKPSIFLWGDSHAASLYPGLNTLQKTNLLSIHQATGCGNPPILALGNYSDEWCDTPNQRLLANQEALSLIKKTHPNIVILHARWAYNHYNFKKSTLIENIKKTANQIHKNSPESKIVVMGPVPNWNESLAKSMLSYWKKTPSHPVPPQYMRDGLVEGIQEWDAHMEKEVPKLGLTYLSPYKLLCKAEGCLTRVGPQASDLTAVDYGHLSPAGSIYVVNRLAPTLFKLLRSN